MFGLKLPFLVQIEFTYSEISSNFSCVRISVFTIGAVTSGTLATGERTSSNWMLSDSGSEMKNGLGSTTS
jgi:hypothetical protein